VGVRLGRVGGGTGTGIGIGSIGPGAPGAYRCALELGR